MGRSSMPTVFLLPALLLAALAATADSLTLKPSCQASCDGVDIPYPYGIGEDCFRPGFQITCMNNTTPVLGDGTAPAGQSPIPVLNISVMPRPEARVLLAVAYQCYNPTGYAFEEFSSAVGLNNARRISNTRNELYVLGCNTFAESSSGSVSSSDDYTYWTGCVAYCNDSRSAQDGVCAGIGCCHVEIPPGIIGNHGMTFRNNSHLRVLDFNPCDSAFIVDKANYTFRTADLKKDPRLISRPVVLDWAIRDTNVNSTDNNYSCAQAPNRPDYACVSHHSVCVDSYNGPGYVCNCTEGYEGNPYLKDGCTNINECARSQDFPCHGECQDTEGSYICTCHPGKVGDPKKNTCSPKLPPEAKLALGISVGVSLLVVAILVAFIMLQKRKLDKLFEKNGGKILQNVKGLTIFSKEELKKITQNNSEFLGNGSFGKVYKGTLSDKSMVAVKASIKVNEDTKQEFAQEVEIHTHMIHKNILKLIGCCLEVDVPMLVYEFAANGSLKETLHGNKSQKLSLDLRLDIAIGSAEGLRYMHSFTTEAIRHGDVKPDNILLDDKLTPKVSDFGLSKLLKEEYVVKTVVGCMGYIDPVFMKTGLLTQKSDVYSFGAVLLELITGKKIIYDENRSLIIEFCKVYEKEKSGRAMFDKGIIMTQEDIFVLEEIGMLAIECLKENIEDRPDMTEVAERLVMVRRDRKIGKTQNSGPRHFEDMTMDESPNNTGINK